MLTHFLSISKSNSPVSKPTKQYDKKLAKKIVIYEAFNQLKKKTAIIKMKEKLCKYMGKSKVNLSLNSAIKIGIKH
jgi:hypothetical protein